MSRVLEAQRNVEISRLRRGGMSCVELCKKFGLGKNTIRQICNWRV